MRVPLVCVHFRRALLLLVRQPLMQSKTMRGRECADRVERPSVDQLSLYPTFFAAIARTYFRESESLPVFFCLATLICLDYTAVTWYTVEIDLIHASRDASARLFNQDRVLADRIQSDGRACVVVCNKWDLVEDKDDSTYNKVCNRC